MIYNAINNFDMLNDACIRYTSVISDTLGITYGTMCIYCISSFRCYGLRC